MRTPAPPAHAPATGDPAENVPPTLADPEQPPPRPSLRPALLVLGIALGIVLLGAIVAIVTGSGSPGPGIRLSANGARVPGVSLRADAARPFLARIASEGEPPVGIVDSLTVPGGSVYVSHDDADRGVDQFDRSVTFTVAARPGSVETFYRTELRLAAWQSQSAGPAAGGYELLDVRDGSDGYQWGVGVVIATVEPTLSPALGGDSAGGPTSRVTLTLYQVEDSS